MININVHIIKNIHNHIHLDEGSEIPSLMISSDFTLSNDKKNALADLLKEHIRTGNLVLSNKAGSKKAIMQANLLDEENSKVLDFYKGKLNPDWFRALELCLIIRKAAKEVEAADVANTPPNNSLVFSHKDINV